MRKSEKKLILVSIRKVQLNVLKVWWNELTVMAIHQPELMSASRPQL